MPHFDSARLLPYKPSSKCTLLSICSLAMCKSRHITCPHANMHKALQKASLQLHTCSYMVHATYTVRRHPYNYIHIWYMPHIQSYGRLCIAGCLSTCHRKPALLSHLLFAKSFKCDFLTSDPIDGNASLTSCQGARLTIWLHSSYKKQLGEDTVVYALLILISQREIKESSIVILTPSSVVFDVCVWCCLVQ